MTSQVQKTDRKQWGLALIVCAAGMWALTSADVSRVAVSGSGTNQTPIIAQSQAPAAPLVMESAQQQSEPVGDVDPVTGVAATAPTIVMVTQDGCAPCVKWWNQRGSWEQQGWTVLKVDAANTVVRETPTFRIFHQGEWREHVGFMRPDDARAVLGIARKAAAKVVSIARGTYQGGREWSYPGDISNHLMGSNHGFTAEQLAGKSKAELERMHSQHHESMRAGTAIMSRQVGSYSSGSSCPGGSCPTSAPVRRGLFGRW